MAPFVVQFPRGKRLSSTRQETHSNFQQAPSLRLYLLYNLDIALKVIRVSKPETQESFNTNATLFFHYLQQAEIFWIFFFSQESTILDMVNLSSWHKITGWKPVLPVFLWDWYFDS